jgi:hypothetical protein
MSLSALWTFLAVSLPMLAALLAPMSTVDLTYHMRAGAEMAASGSIPTVDTWTFTAAGEPWFDQQWGAQVILRLTETVGGWTGLAILRAALTGVIFGSLFSIARHRGLDARVAALLTLAAFVVAAPAMALRPQLMGMALFAVLLVIIDRRRTSPRLLWAAPLVILVWANVHGSFFLGPVSLGLAWLADVHDRYARATTTLGVALVSAAAACITPFGPAVWLYAVGLSSNAEVSTRVTEWQPTSLRTVPGILFFGSVGAVVALLARRGRPTPWPTLAWLAVFFVIGAYAERGVAWWPLAAVSAVVGLLEPRPVAARTESSLIRRANALVAVVIVVAGIALLPLWRPIEPRTGVPAAVLTDAPPGITDALRSAVVDGDRVFNPQRWGSWIEYAVPNALVAIDSRVEFFPPGAWRQYDAVGAGGHGWADWLDASDVRFVVTMPTQRELADRLIAEGWRVHYEGGDGVILTRD